LQSRIADGGGTAYALPAVELVVGDARRASVVRAGCTSHAVADDNFLGKYARRRAPEGFNRTLTLTLWIPDKLSVWDEAHFKVFRKSGRAPRSSSVAT
jgi:hypothetical protein